MDIAERLAKERRGRLAAERLLEQKSRELFAANQKLALHARSLSDQIVEQRQVVEVARSEAAALKGQQSRFLDDLDRAHTTAVMAERRLLDSIETIADGFAVFDAGLNLVLANDAFQFRFSNQPLTPGTPYSAILGAAASDRLILTDEPQIDWLARMLARLEADTILPEVLRFPDGGWGRLTEQRARDGDLVCLLADITEEKRIWAAIEAIPDGFVLFDREEKLLACNQQYRDMFPDSAEFMIPGTSFEDLLRHGLRHAHVPEAEGREEEWLADRLFQMRAATGTQECQLASGRWILERDHVTPDGGRVGLRSDVTQLREQQAALVTARAEAEAANRAKSAFLANMSHEIRTPMNGVVGMAELLCDTTLTEEQRLFAETIRSSGEALLVIINDILDYSKIEAERLMLYPEPFDLERTIHEVVMLLQPRSREKGLELMIDFDMFLPTRYVGDPGRIRQVLTNLVGNAVKFTATGHVLVRVVGFEAEDGTQKLHVTVEDTGIGIASEHLDHIFGEFNQVESQANRKFEGTGLGLAITAKLIERMEGAVWVDSEPGKGSAFGFSVTFPIAEEATAPRLPTRLRHVLVVDDQFINRTILERQLVPCGITVTLCRSGTEAMEALARGATADLILTDHQMPDMDGLTLTGALRAAGHEQPIVLLTSNPGAAKEHPAMADIAAVLQKPLLRADLYRKLRDLTQDPEAVLPPIAPIVPLASEVRPMRVLIAEDNRTNQLVFQKMARSFGIDMHFANNGVEAVALWQTLLPDLIFMDISMPEMDGREATRAIRSQETTDRRTPIVALTAHAMDGDAESILAAGVDRYMTKPLRKAAIFEVLAEFCPDGVQPPTAGETPVASANPDPAPAAAQGNAA